MKNFYFATTEEQNGKYFATVLKFAGNANLLSILSQHKNLKVVHACGSKAKAEELADFWNESYKANGTYLFD